MELFISWTHKPSYTNASGCWVSALLLSAYVSSRITSHLSLQAAGRGTWWKVIRDFSSAIRCYDTLSEAVSLQ